MRLLFVVQGEGRGHITQAISLSQQLEPTNHELVGCLVGTNDKSGFASILEDKLTAPVHFFKSPNLVYNLEKNGISLRQTIWENLAKLSEHNRSLNAMKEWIDKYKPDLIINFYDFLAGIYQLRFMLNAPPMICIGHQYLLLHQQFKFPKNNGFDRFLVNLNSRFTAMKAKKMLALTFSPYPQQKKIVSVPPLMRKSALEEKTGNYSYFLAYLTSELLLEQLKSWHKNNTKVELHCFTKSSQENEVTQHHKNFFVHKLDTKKFLSLMANAKGLISTAGFEAVCEAIYYGKPVMMVPVPNHFEQACNAFDAESYGAGISQKNFDLDFFLEYTHHFESKSLHFKSWLGLGKNRVLQEIESLVS